MFFVVRVCDFAKKNCENVSQPKKCNPNRTDNSYIEFTKPAFGAGVAHQCKRLFEKLFLTKGVMQVCILLFTTSYL